MCNRYASDIRKAGLEREFYGFEEFSETRLPPQLLNAVWEVFPKSLGPVIVRSDDGGLAWRRMRWGLPGPPASGGAPVTNLRNLASPHWRPLLGPAHRCLVPFSAFCEPLDGMPKGGAVLKWFAPADRSLWAFAGVWRTWTGDVGTKAAPNVGEHALFAFLTTAANDRVRPVHAKAMPVVLRTAAEREEWLTAEAGRVSAIQARALPTDALDILSEADAEQFGGAYVR